ncbi:MAG: GTP cyclohydrolase I FolE [Pseudomonadota bacterium]
MSPAAQRVKDALLRAGLETPMIHNKLNNSQKVESILSSVTDIMYALGLDLSDDSLSDTPQRIANMYVNELFAGLDYESFPKITCIDNKMGSDEMVKVADIELVSTCEHHFVTIDGKATVAYVPGSKVIGLSKINRIVQFFAQRPQVQERLTRQILLAMQTLLETEDVAVHIAATHYCVKARGIKDSHSATTTTATGGVFKQDRATRQEFLSRS